MLPLVESSHAKILTKINTGRTLALKLDNLRSDIIDACGRHTEPKWKRLAGQVATIDAKTVSREIDKISDDYTHSVLEVMHSTLAPTQTDTLASTGCNGVNTNGVNNGSTAGNSAATRKYAQHYHEIVAQNAYVCLADACLGRLLAYYTQMPEFIPGLFLREDAAEKNKQIKQAVKALQDAIAHAIDYTPPEVDYEICSCGQRMSVDPDNSELVCGCGNVIRIVGAVFRDEQYYLQEGQRPKHSGYDTSRHYRFWIDRLQAVESKRFEPEEIERIKAAIARRGLQKRELNTLVMRKILKECKLTGLNNHISLLIKTLGGRAPPLLDHSENLVCSERFNKIIRLYEQVNPGEGNKPYYPYFIYKIIEGMFPPGNDKLRLLSYIHLQSRETLTKNDKWYREICKNDPDHELIYRPTDPSRRLF
jgi:hypothetical protein